MIILYYLQLVLLVQCQETIIWLRVSLITSQMVEEYILEDFLQIQEFRLSIQFNGIINILIKENDKIYETIQIQDKIGQWSQIIINKQRDVLVKEQYFKLKVETNAQLKFTQIERNFENFFIQIVRDDKYNNFLLKQPKQLYLKTMTFDTFVSDQDAMITFWFKFMVDYETRNYLYFQSKRNQLIHRFQILLQIEIEQIQIYLNEMKYISINGRLWNQIQIILLQNQIKIRLFNKKRQILDIINPQMIRDIVNKELIFEQQGLYVGHLSIQYQFKQYYCSPGCKNCQNQICLECYEDQYLVHNQCSCIKFYQSQNVAGQCQMLYDIYQNDLFAPDEDQTDECQFGFLTVTNRKLQQSNCVKCPYLQDQLCFYCFNNQAADSNYILECSLDTNQIYFVFEYDQYVLYKNYTYNEIKKVLPERKIQILNNTLLIIMNNNRQKSRSLLFYEDKYKCAYNCECQQFNQQHYCMNNIENKNQKYDIFELGIIALHIQNRVFYIYNKLKYYQLQTILNNIDVDSICLTGVIMIQVEIDLQININLDQKMLEIEQEMTQFSRKVKLWISRLQNNINHPLIHLIIKSNSNYKIKYDWKFNLFGLDYITLDNFSFFSNKVYINLVAVQLIILKNIYFDNSKIHIRIGCFELEIQNVLFHNILWVGQDDSIYTSISLIKLSGIIFSNCTYISCYVFQIQLNPDIYQREYLIQINKILIEDSKFEDSTFMFVSNQNNPTILYENFIVNQTSIHNSFILFSKEIPPEIIIKRFYLANSRIYGRVFTQFKTNEINDLTVANCNFENAPSVFGIYQSNLRIRNLLLFKLTLTNIFSFLHISSHSSVIISFVFIQFLIMNEGQIFRFSDSNAILGFVSVNSSSITVIFNILDSNNVQFNYFIVTESLSNSAFFQIQSEMISIKMFKLTKIKKFYKLFQLYSTNLALEYILFSNFSNILLSNDLNFIQALGNYDGSMRIGRVKFFKNNLVNQNNIQYMLIFYYVHVKIYCITFKENYLIISNGSDYRATQGLIMVKSVNLTMVRIFVIDLKIESKQFDIKVFNLNAKEQIKISYSNFKRMLSIRCLLLLCEATFTRFENIIFFMINLEVESTFIVSQNLLLFNLKVVKVISQHQFIIIRGKKLVIHRSQFSNIQLNSDIIYMFDHKYGIIIYHVLLFQINEMNSSLAIYLLKQRVSLKGSYLDINDLIIITSELGLANLESCGGISIVNSQFIGIQAQQTFIFSRETLEFEIRSSTFQNITLNYHPLIKLNISNNSILISESTIKNIQFIIQNNQSLIEVYGYDSFYFNYNYLFNNTCKRNENISCYLITLIQDQDGKITQFLDTLFKSNQFTKIINYLNFSEIDNLRQDIVIPSIFYQSTYSFLNVVFYYRKILNYEQNFSMVNKKNIKLIINNYYLLESLINLKHKLNNKNFNVNNNPQDQVVYLPSGQYLNKYKLLNELNYKQYINKFMFELIDPKKINCSLNAVESFNGLEDMSQSFIIQLNQDLSNILQFRMDPYNKQYKYSLQLVCEDDSILQKIQYRIQPLPCQKGEYYKNQQCNLCNIQQLLNTLQKNQNKCDYFDQKVVSEMKQGLIKLKFGYWRSYYHDKDAGVCESLKCLGGWQVGDQSCVQGSSGALCQECDIYNKRGNGSYSKLQDQQCVPCSTNNNCLIIYAITIFCYQLIRINISSVKSQRYISNWKRQIQQHKQYKILLSLQIDQISINFKILQDAFIKIILFNKLTVILPDIISVSLNLIPTELVNKGLYCNIYHLGPNILLLELICIFAFTMFLIQFCIVIYMFLVTSRKFNNSITYVTTIFQYGYKQSYIYISQLQKLFYYIRLLTQLIYVKISSEFYLIGNQQYQYKYYKHITFKVILPIYLIYSILIPIIIIIILQAQSYRKGHKFQKLWAYYIQNYNSHFQFWDVYYLLQCSLLQFIYFFFYQQKHNQFILFCVAILLDLVLQKNIKVYNLKKLNVIQYDTQLKMLALQTLLYYYYQIENQYVSLSLFGLIMIIIFNIVIRLISNITKRIIVQYVHYTLQYQGKIIRRFPKFIFIQKKFNFDQNPARAKFNFQKLIQLIRNKKSDPQKNQPIFQHKPPNNSLSTEQSQEIELIDFQKYVQH